MSEEEIQKVDVILLLTAEPFFFMLVVISHWTDWRVEQSDGEKTIVYVTKKMRTE